MKRRPPPTSLAELTIEALRYRSKRWDWDWVICYHIREWEKRTRKEYENAGLTLLHGFFAWYHWHAICDRVFFRATQDLSRVKRVAMSPRDSGTVWDYARDLRRDIVFPECATEFERLGEELEAHGLPLYGDGITDIGT